MESNQTDLYSRFTALKQYGVETWITIGGWAMNDPGEYSNVFSDLAASSTAQKAFLDSLVSFLGAHGFDGVDFDWYLFKTRTQGLCSSALLTYL